MVPPPPPPSSQMQLTELDERIAPLCLPPPPPPPPPPPASFTDLPNQILNSSSSSQLFFGVTHAPIPRGRNCPFPPPSSDLIQRLLFFSVKFGRNPAVQTTWRKGRGEGGGRKNAWSAARERERERDASCTRYSRNPLKCRQTFPIYWKKNCRIACPTVSLRFPLTPTCYSTICLPL